MNKGKPRCPVYIVFEDEEELDKYESGEHHSNKGMRDRKERFTKQPDFVPMSDEDIISEAEKILSMREAENLPEHEMSTLQIIWDSVKGAVLDVLYAEAMELKENPEKRAIVLARINRLWKEKIVPTGSKLIETAKFYKDVFHAVKTDEKPKVLKLLDEIKDMEVAEKNSVVSSEEKVSVEMTEEQRNRLLFAMVLAADTLKGIKVVKTDIAGKEYQLEKGERDKFLIEEEMKVIEALMGNGFELDESAKNFVFEYLKIEADKVPFPI